VTAPTVPSEDRACAVVLDRLLKSAVDRPAGTVLTPAEADAIQLIERATGEQLLEDITIQTKIEAARHAVRHPATGQFHPAVAPGIPAPFVWSNHGAVHPALLGSPSRPRQQAEGQPPEGPTTYTADEVA
jgi:hypothetical protein